MKNITKLITSLALIGILTLTIVMSTVAWFSANQEVEATGITVKAGVETYMDMGSLTYQSGSLTPAVAKLQAGDGQVALTPLEMFDTSKVATRATAVKYTTTINYASDSVGQLSFNVTATIGVATTDYVRYGELAYIAVFDCNEVSSGKKLLLYGYYTGVGSTVTQSYYYNSGTTPYGGFANISDLGSPNTWYALSSSVTNIYNGTKMLLQPGKSYGVSLYVFPTKTDEEIDPALLGANVSITSLIDVN